MLKRKIIFVLSVLISLSCLNISIYAEETLSTTHTVTFMHNGEVFKTTCVQSGNSLSDYPLLDSSNNYILAWVLDGKKINNLSSLTFEEDAVLTVWKAPYPDLSSHHSYINGNGGMFRPNDSLSRAEFCVIFDSLYTTFNNGCTTIFPDVVYGEWYYDVVSNIISAGIMSGYPDGTFRPNEKMSRAEFLSVLCCGSIFGNANPSFKDTDNHWAKDVIAYSQSRGWIVDDGSGLFRPDDPITRAEAVVIFNRVLGRSASASTNYIAENNIYPFIDVKYSDPYYFDIMEATIDHSYSNNGAEEVWTDFSYKNCGFETGVALVNGNGYLVDSNNQFCLLPAWSFVEVNGNTYLTNGDGSVNLSYKGLTEIYGSMYYFTDSGRIYKDEYLGNLYFGPDGRYTSGNTEIDEYVDALIKATTTDDMSQDEKLYSAYIYIRDNSKYLGRSHYERGATDFTEETALFMFRNNMKGNCYCFASCFLYVAKRLGYQDAYIVSGGVGDRNLNHAWVMINSNIYDVEYEYAHLYQYEDKQYYNLFNLPVSQEPFHYYFPE